MAGFHTKTFLKHDDYMTPKYAWENIKQYIPQDKINELFNILGQQSPIAPGLEEMSAASGGMNGYAAPFPGKRDKKKKTPDIIRREQKQTVDDVIRLLMEKGIMS